MVEEKTNEFSKQRSELKKKKNNCGHVGGPCNPQNCLVEEIQNVDNEIVNISTPNKNRQTTGGTYGRNSRYKNNLRTLTKESNDETNATVEKTPIKAKQTDIPITNSESSNVKNDQHKIVFARNSRYKNNLKTLSKESNNDVTPIKNKTPAFSKENPEYLELVNLENISKDSTENTNERIKIQTPAKIIEPFSRDSAEYLEWKKKHTIPTPKKSTEKVQKTPKKPNENVQKTPKKPIEKVQRDTNLSTQELTDILNKISEVPKEKSKNLEGIMVEDEFCPDIVGPKKDMRGPGLKDTQNNKRENFVIEKPKLFKDRAEYLNWKAEQNSKKSDAPEKLIGNDQTKGNEKIDYNCEIVMIEKPGCSIVFNNDPNNQMAKINWKKEQSFKKSDAPHTRNDQTNENEKSINDCQIVSIEKPELPDRRKQIHSIRSEWTPHPKNQMTKITK